MEQKIFNVYGNVSHLEDLIEDPQCFGLNCEPAYATQLDFRNLQTGKNLYLKVLNGNDWFFLWYKSVSDMVVARDDKSRFAEAETITIPGNWEIKGYGFPIYTNIGSAGPLELIPPRIQYKHPAGMGSGTKPFTPPANLPQRTAGGARVCCRAVATAAAP